MTGTFTRSYQPPRAPTQSERSEKRERNSISLPLSLSDLVLDASGFFQYFVLCWLMRSTSFHKGLSMCCWFLGILLSLGCSVLGEPLPVTPERIRPGSWSTGVSLASTWSAWRSGCWSWCHCCLRKGGDTSCLSPGTAPGATSATFAWAQLGPRWWKDTHVSRRQSLLLLLFVWAAMGNPHT